MHGDQMHRDTLIPRPHTHALFALALLAMGGCIFPYCVYPKLSYTPSLKLDQPAGDVRAFRVDLGIETGDVWYGDGHLESLAEIPVTNADEVPAQLKPSVTTRWAMIGIALNYVTYNDYSVALRLYRPGYELTEVKSWQLTNRVAWKPATEIATQEAALDALLPIARLEGGSKTEAHREALLFGASEYERLAAAAVSIEQAENLGAKAKKLRERAEE
jgi:hypothetical protein